MLLELDDPNVLQSRDDNACRERLHDRDHSGVAKIFSSQRSPQKDQGCSDARLSQPQGPGCVVVRLRRLRVLDERDIDAEVQQHAQ